MQNSENNEVPVTPNPNPGAPVVPPVTPEATPPVNPVIPAAGPTPMTAQSANSMKSNDSLGTAAVLTALVPPVGLILGILSIIKGSKSGNKKLSLFGGVAILLSVIIGLLYAFVVIPRIPALAGSKYSKTKNITINKGSLNLTVPIPEAYEEDTKVKTASDQGFDVEVKRYDIYVDPKTKKEVIAALEVQALDLSSLANLASLSGEKVSPDDLLKQAIETSNDEIEKSIVEATSGSSPFTNVKVTTKEKSGDNGVIVKFTAQGKSSSGKTVELEGEQAIYVSKDFTVVTISQAVEKNVYKKNKKVFDNINLSIKNQVK